MTKIKQILKILKNETVLKFMQNIFAYALPVCVQQFIVYPIMAKKLGAELNGRFLALIALVYFVTNITASVLVNTRLLLSNKYKENKINGDFNCFLIVFAILNSFVIVGGTIFYTDCIDVFDIILSVVVVVLFLYHDYILVQYRAELRFKDILYNNIILCIGYVIGLAVLYFAIQQWQLVFIIPYLMTTVYDYIHTDYIKEPRRITPLFKETLHHYFILLFSALLTSLVTYGDRLILYPLMDGTSVSIFNSAQLIGKLLQMISTPIATFLLAYLVKMKGTGIRIRSTYIIALVTCSITLYFTCLLISRPLISFLYPSWVDQSMNYVVFTSANGVLHMLNSLINVFVLTFCKRKWQVVKSSTYLILYMTGSFTLLHFFGLTGFCIGNLIASTGELLLLAALILNYNYRLVKAKKD